jgi:hypothetical protein
MSESVEHVLSYEDQQDMVNRIHPRLTAISPYVLEAGQLLTEVRDRRLWLVHADSFKHYAEEVLGLTRQRVYQLMDAAEVINSLPERCQPEVDTERKARVLNSVPPKKRAAVVDAAKQNGSYCRVTQQSRSPSRFTAETETHTAAAKT